MARTIGRKFKNQIVRLVKEAYDAGIGGWEIPNYVKEFLPQDAYDTWESAHSEIERLIDDEVFKIMREVTHG
jgi:hypothetical protein